MLKRGISILLTAVLILVSLPATAWAAEIVESGTIGYGSDAQAITWTLDSDGVLTLSGKGRTSDASSSGFSHLSDSIKKIVIEEGIDTIGTRLFADCKMVEHVEFPDSLEKIDRGAFSGCTSLQEINFPKNLKYMGQAVFSGCTSLTHVELPNGVQWISNLTGGGMFSDCTALSEVTLPDDMTFLGSHMFSGCKALTHIDLPKGLTGIGIDAFRNTNLQSIDLHEGITTIGEYAFSATPLKEVILPKTLKTLEGSAFLSCEQLAYVYIPDHTISYFTAFNGCSALTELRIPEGVTHMTAYGCDNLESISLPASLRTIDRVAFQGDTALTQITIPDGVTSIGYNAFQGCDNLKHIILPDSFKSDGGVWCPMTQKTPHRTIHYKGSREQWEANVSSSYTESAIKNKYITVIYDSTGEIGEARSACYVPPNEHGFAVRDAVTGEPVVGATVTVTTTKDGTVNTETLTTNKKGVAHSAVHDDSWVEITADGYSPWNNANPCWTTTGIQLEMVLLWPESYGAYKLTGARFGLSKSAFRSLDLVTNSHVLNLNSAEPINSTTFYLSCSVYDSSNVEKYELYQWNRKIAECGADGQFENVSVNPFAAGGGCRVRVTTKDGQTTTTPIRLSFVDNVVYKTEDAQSDFRIPDIAFSIDSEVPYLGGQVKSISTPGDFPVQLIAAEDKMQIAINIGQLATGESGAEEIQKKYNDAKERIDAYDAYVNGAFRNYGYNPPRYSDLESIYDMIESEPTVTGLIDDWDCAKVSLMGYLEGNWGDTTVSGKLVATASFNIGAIRYNTVIGVVPVTASVGFNLSGSSITQISYDYVEKMMHGKWEFDGKAAMNAFAGVGYDKYIGAGAYGTAELETLVRIAGDYPHGLRKGSIRGELGLKAYVGGAEISRAWAESEWVFADLGDDLPVPGTSSAASASDSLTAALYDASGYTPEDLSYLTDSEGWTGGNASELNANLTEMKTLVSGVYRNAQPVMISTGDALVAAYVMADAAGNRQIAITKFDGSTWSTPVLVPGGTLDGSPALCMGTDGTVKLAFTRTTGATDGTLKDFAWKQNIIAGSVDLNSLTFTQEKVFAPVSRSGYVCAPTLTAVNGQIVLAWVENIVTTDDEVLMPASSSIYTAKQNGSSWSDAAQFAAAEGAIRSFAIGSTGGSLAAAYIADGSLYRTTGNDAAQLAEGVNGKVSYGTLFASDTACFYWNQGNELVTENGTAIPAEGITGEYQMTNTGLYYSAPAAEGSELMVVRPQGTGWTEPMQATVDGLYLENLSVATMAGADYAFGINTTVTISEGSVEDSKDLVWARVTPIYGLRLDKVEFDEEGLAYKDKVTLKATVTNTGDAAVQYFRFVLDGDSSKPYTCNENKVNLLPGETREFEITSFLNQYLTYPNTPTEHTLEALFYANDNLTDFDPSDNSWTFTLGRNDVALDLDYAVAGEQRLLLATVTNEGMEAMDGTVTYYDADGSVLGRSAFSGVEPGGTVQTTYTVGGKFAAAAGGVVRADVTVYGDDFYSYNNSDSAYVEPLEPGIVGFALEDQTLGASVLMDAGSKGHALCAFYDANGRMIAVESADLTAGLNEGLTFERRGAAAAAKLFVIADGGTPMFAARELKLR